MQVLHACTKLAYCRKTFKRKDEVVIASLKTSVTAAASFLTLQNETKTPVKGLPRPSTEQDLWSKDHLTPSWVCLPNDQPVLAIIQPGESALDMLETICKVTPAFVLLMAVFKFRGSLQSTVNVWRSLLKWCIPPDSNTWPNRIHLLVSRCRTAPKTRCILSDISVWVC